MTDDFKAQYEDARNQVDDLVNKLAHALGPQVVENTGDEDIPVFLNGWVSVFTWTDSNGESYTTRITSRNLPSHHRIGLLHQALYSLD